MPRKHLKLWPTALAVIALGSWIPAQAIDLKQAYDAAAAEDATLRAARAAAEAGRERLPQALSQLRPNVSLSASGFRNHLETTAPNLQGQSSTSVDNYSSNNAAIVLKQPLYRKQLNLNYQQAQLYVNEAELTLAREVQNLAVRVSGAFFDALLTQDQLTLLESQKKATQAQLDAARKALEAGTGTRTDIDEAQARLDLTIAQELEALQNVDYTRRQLQVLTNQAVTDLPELDAKALQLRSPEPAVLGEWLDKAEQNSPEIQALKARLEAARVEVSKASAGHLPTVDAVAQWSRSSSENVTRINSTYNNKQIGIQVSVPLYSGGYVSSTVRQALAEQERAEQLLEATRRDLGVRLHKEFRGVTEGVLRIRALEQAVKSAEQALESSKKSYAAGVRTVLDTLNAEQQLMTARRDLAQARYVYLMSQVRLNALAGQADAQHIADLNAWFKPRQ